MISARYVGSSRNVGLIRFSAIARSVMISACRSVLCGSPSLSFSAIARSVMISALELLSIITNMK